MSCPQSLICLPEKADWDVGVSTLEVRAVMRGGGGGGVRVGVGTSMSGEDEDEDKNGMLPIEMCLPDVKVTAVDLRLRDLCFCFTVGMVALFILVRAGED